MTRDEADRIDEQMYRAGGAPDERELLGEAFDAENGAGASDELRRLAAENTWPGESKGFEADLAEIEAGLNLIYNAANDEMLGSLRSECVAALQRLRLRLRAEATS